MIPVNQQYLAAIRAPVRTDRITGSIQLADGGSLEFTADDLMSGSVTIDDQCVSGDELQFGCVYLGQAAFQLRTQLNRYRFYGGRLTLTYGIRLADGSWYELPLGVYTISEAERTALYVSIKAYDNALLLDKAFDGEALQGTPFQMLSRICEKCGLTLGQTEVELAAFPNAAETFQLDGEDGCESYRDCVGAIAQVLAGFGTVDRAGALVIRAFSAQPSTALGPEARTGATVADYSCRYTSLVIEGAQDFSCGDAAADGLEMRMSDAPLFGKGLTGRNQAVADAVFAALSAIRYVPATLTMAGDPSLECGDRITLTDLPGAGGSAEMLVTHRVWKFRGRQTLKAVGRNPYLVGNRSRTDTALRRLQTQADQSRTLSYRFTNPVPVTAGTTQVQLCRIAFVTTQATTLLFLAQLPLSAQPAASGGTLLLRVAYYLDGTPLDFSLAQTLPAGEHALALCYPLAEVAANTSGIFSVRITAEGGQVTVAANGVQALLSGRSLVESSAADNNLQLEDRLPSPALAAPARPVLDSLTGQVSAAPQTPQRRTGQETLAPLRWTPAGPAVDTPAEQAPVLEL